MKIKLASTTSASNFTWNWYKIVEEDYQGPPEIDEVEVIFSEDGFPDLQVTKTPDTSTVQLMQRIKQPAAQKMEIAKKKIVNHWPVSSKNSV